MKLLVNSEGIIGANPDMELPVMPLCTCDVDGLTKCNAQFKAYESAMQIYWDGFVPFEDQEAIWYEPSVYLFMHTTQPNTPNHSVIEADIEYKVLEQYWSHCQMWMPVETEGEKRECPKRPDKYRRILRLKN